MAVKTEYRRRERPIFDCSNLQGKPGSLRCPTCGRTSAVLFVATGSQEPRCHECVRAAIAGTGPSRPPEAA